jgi:hypothetical protein
MRGQGTELKALNHYHFVICSYLDGCRDLLVEVIGEKWRYQGRYHNGRGLDLAPRYRA